MTVEKRTWEADDEQTCEGWNYWSLTVKVYEGCVGVLGRENTWRRWWPIMWGVKLLTSCSGDTWMVKGWRWRVEYVKKVMINHLRSEAINILQWMYMKFVGRENTWRRLWPVLYWSYWCAGKVSKVCRSEGGEEKSWKKRRPNVCGKVLLTSYNEGIRIV